MAAAFVWKIGPAGAGLPLTLLKKTEV